MAIKYDTWRAPSTFEQQLVDCAQAFDTRRDVTEVYRLSRLSTSNTVEDSPLNFRILTMRSTRSVPSTGSMTPETSPFLPTSAGVAAEVPEDPSTSPREMSMLSSTTSQRKDLSLSHFKSQAIFVTTREDILFERVQERCDGCESRRSCRWIRCGSSTQMPYWTIKNDWDYSWGNEGFFEIEAFKNMAGTGVAPF